LKASIAVLLALALSACALPQTTVRTGALQPGLIVQGAPSNSVLYVDGLSMGYAQQFDGKPKVLAVIEGVHTLEIHQGTTVIFHDKALFSNGETHPIKLLPGAAQ
jgi:uncharacterized lipoprotein YmbA